MKPSKFVSGNVDRNSESVNLNFPLYKLLAIDKMKNRYLFQKYNFALKVSSLSKNI